MRRVRLADVVEEISTRINDPSASGYSHFVGLEHYDAGEMIISRFGSTEKLASAVKVFEKNDILVARRNVYLRRAGIIHFAGVTSGDSIVLRAKEKRICRIIPFVLNTDDFWDYAERYSDGTMSKRLSPKTLLEYEFFLPDDDKIDQTSDLLWAAYNAKLAYKNLISELDNLVKSQFIEMFYGKGYPEKNIGEVIEKGVLRVSKVFSKDDEIQYLDISSIDNTNKTVTGLTPYTLKDAPSRAQYVLKYGDIVYSTVRPNLQNIAINTYKAPNVVGSTGFCVLRCVGVTTGYMWGVITGTDFTKAMISQASGANYPAVTDKVVHSYRIPVPPMDEQERFDRIVKQSDKSKFELKQAIEKTENLIKTIMTTEIK